MKRGLQALLSAGLIWGALWHSPLGAPVWSAAGRQALVEGRTSAAVVAFQRAVRLGPDGRRWQELGMAQAAAGETAPARRALLTATLSRDAGARRDAFHALSALHLEAVRLPDERRAGETPSEHPGSAAAAARAAMDGLRLEPGHPGLSWNLFLARNLGGFPEPESTSEGLDPATARALRSALRSAENRSLRESVSTVTRALEARRTPVPREGPPW